MNKQITIIFLVSGVHSSLRALRRGIGINYQRSWLAVDAIGIFLDNGPGLYFSDLFVSDRDILGPSMVLNWLVNSMWLFAATGSPWP